MFKNNSRGQRLLNLILKPECAVKSGNIAQKNPPAPQTDALTVIAACDDENNDFASKNSPSQWLGDSLIQPENQVFDIPGKTVDVIECVKSLIPESNDDSLITTEDLGYVNDRVISSSPSLLLPPPAAATPELESSDDNDETPLVLSSQAIIHNILHSSNAAFREIEYQDESTKSSTGKPSPPGLDVIQPFGSDDSVEDPHWAPPSKIRRLILLSDSEDEVPLLSLRPIHSNLLENIPLPSDDEVEHQDRPSKISENRRLVNRKARVLGKTFVFVINF